MGQGDLRASEPVLVRTYFDDSTAWSEVLLAVTSSGPDGSGPPVAVVNDRSLEGMPWNDVLHTISTGDTVPTVLFVADVEGMRSGAHTLLVVDTMSGHEPFRSDPAEAWDIEANLESENLSFSELAAEARSNGGRLPISSAGAADPGARAPEVGFTFATRSVARGSRPRTVDSLLKEVVVMVPTEVGALVTQRAADRGVTIEDLVHEFVLADEGTQLRTPTPPREGQGSTVAIKLSLGSVLSVLLTGGARTAGFETVEEYSAAVLQHIAQTA